MARRAAGPAGPLHSAQDPAPGERGADHRADTSPDGVAPAGPGLAGPGADAHLAEAEDLERLPASLLHGRAAHVPPLRVEDPVHPPTASGTGWSGTGWSAGRPDDAVDPDALAGDESTVMHPDDLAALHALPTTTAEARAWRGAGAEDHAWTGDLPPAVHGVEGRRLVGTAPGLSVWDDGNSWDDPSWGDEPTVGLLQQRWLQLTVCALLALVVGAALALLLSGRQVEAARAEADRQRQIASSAQADLVRERAARTSERADDAALPPVPAAPLDDLPQPPATEVDPSVVAPPPPSDQQRPPVAEAPAPTADPGPPPPGPSPAASPDGQGGAARSSQPSAQDTPAQDATTSTTRTDDPECDQGPDGTGGDGLASCP